MKTIKYRTAPVNLVIGDVPLNRFYVLHNGTVYSEYIYETVSKKSGLPVPLVRSTDELIDEEVKALLQHGYRVELPNVSYFITLPGSVESLSPEARAAACPMPVVRATAKRDLRTCCQGDDYVVQNIASGVSVVVYSIIDSVSQRQNVLTNGHDIAVSVVGTGLYIPDASDPTIGAYISGDDGRILATARVTESTSTTLECVFDALALPEGTDRSCGASRNGQDAGQYGVSVGRKKITLVNAVEEEGV